MRWATRNFGAGRCSSVPQADQQARVHGGRFWNQSGMILKAIRTMILDHGPDLLFH
jgi:hypothetical protein